jgi:hypothetical protein
MKVADILWKIRRINLEKICSSAQIGVQFYSLEMRTEVHPIQKM